MDTLFYFRADRALSNQQIVLGLEPEPEIKSDHPISNAVATV